MQTPILGSSYRTRSVNAADNRMVNLFPEAIPEGGKDAAYLMRAPGTRLFANVGDGPIRGMWQMGEYGYIVSSDILYQIDVHGSALNIGYVDGLGQVSMADNGTQLFVACNPSGFIYDSSTRKFTQITDPNFLGAVTVTFLNQYFVFFQPNSQTVYHSEPNDGLSISANTQSAEGFPDNLVSCIADHKELWLFGTNSIEVWYNSGPSDQFPENIFAPIQGAFIQIGCAATFSVSRLDNSLFWLGQDINGNGMVYRSAGYSPQRISTHAIEWQIQDYERIDDAIAYGYQQDGHSFYVLTFPSASKTWVYDVATKAWHERASFFEGKFYRHRSNCQMFFGSQNLVGDYENGDIYIFDLEDYSDNGRIQKWVRSWRALPPGENTLKRSAHHTLQLDAQTGHKLPEPIYILETELKDFLITESGLDLVADVSDEYIVSTKSIFQPQTVYNVKHMNTTNSTPNKREVIIMSPGEYLLSTYKGDLFVTNTDQNILVANVPPKRKPEFFLRWSDDGGHTWSNERWASAGNVGQYGTRVLWHRLGMTLRLRDRVYEVSGTDPIKIAIMGAELYATQSRS